MTKYKKQNQPSAETMNEADKIARATQRPSQTKEQTRLISLGIQKGIAEYKKQQKSKSRELEKLKKQYKQKLEKQKDQSNTLNIEENRVEHGYKTQWLPWSLLLLSWIGFVIYIVIK